MTSPVLSFTLFVLTSCLNYLANIRQLDLWFSVQANTLKSVNAGLNSRLLDGITGVAEKWKTGYRDLS